MSQFIWFWILAIFLVNLFYFLRWTYRSFRRRAARLREAVERSKNDRIDP